ncbi:MAG: nucleotidyl transferase AbiEii/AbiGii toxin family protein [Lutisporaceae bacterium]
MADVAASVLARLRNKANEQGIGFQQILNLFYQEEFIRRLTLSRYREKLILKGGFLLYLISEFTTRPTMDSDYLLKDYSNDFSSIEMLVSEIITNSTGNDFIRFEIKNLEKIAEVKEYHGIRVNLIGLIANTKTPFSIDFGVGDIIVPTFVERTLPTLLAEFDRPQIFTYSLESTISEKLDAIISLMEANGRMKDFYDIYYLATSFSFEGRKLQEAIYETLSHRGTPYEKDSVVVLSRLAEDDNIQKRWLNFCKKVLHFELDLYIVIEVIIKLTLPPFKAMVEENEFFGKWNLKSRRYEP